MKSFREFLVSKGELIDEKKKWIQDAINPEHKGYCTPTTKRTCTPRRKALAMRFKPGGDLYKGRKRRKKKD